MVRQGWDDHSTALLAELEKPEEQRIMPDAISVNVDGSAGVGKSYLIGCLEQMLRTKFEAADLESPLNLAAPTGCAAHNINGQTLHSLLHLATGADIGGLSLKAKQRLQKEFEHVHYMIIDEKSMVGLKMLGTVDNRLCVAKPAQDGAFFGGLSMLLVSDFAQLDPVGDASLIAGVDEGNVDQAKIDGKLAYPSVAISVKLTTLQRQNENDASSQAFIRLLKNARDGTCDQADVDLHWSQRSTSVTLRIEKSRSSM